MNNQPSSCPWLPIAFAIIILGITANIFFGGLADFYNYQKSVTPNFKLDTELLHFFTREYIQRNFQKLTADKLEPASISEFQLFVDEADIELLNEELPASGKLLYKQGHLSVDKGDFSSEIEFRYRGGLPLHWLYEKKSFRLKLPPFTTYRGARRFDLVNPSTVTTITDWISYEMASDIGLLTPEYFPARVFINGKYNGLHYYLSAIDESFLRINGRMPGSIYAGDTLYAKNPFGPDSGMERTFRDEDGIPLMWEDARLWKKQASRNAESEAYRDDIEKYITIINEDDPVTFMRDFADFFNTELFYNFWGLDTITGSFHHDNFHNHKIYFDPYKGKFEPIEWDLRFWTSEFKFKDLPVNQLMKQVILNPLLEYERDQATQALLARFPVDTVLEKIDRKASIARKELRSDPYRQHADPHYGRFIPQKTVPFSMKNYDKAINKLKTGFKQRSKFVQSELDSVEAFYVVEKKGDDYLVTISASGNSPFRLDITRISALFGNNAQIYRYHDSFLDNPLRLSEAMFYPGRKVVPGNFMNSWNEWSIMAAGNEMFQPSPLHYQLLVKKADFKMSDTLPALSAVNAVTENPVNILPATNLPSSNTTASIHPWTIAAASVPNDPVVEFSGMVNVHKNIHISADQRVIIHPGTTFKIAHNTSIVFEGSVNANGTVEQPILFTRAHPDYEWGSLIIHSRPNADDIPSVKLKGIIVEGGSLTTHKLVNYPGQINIHEAQGFLLSDCTIRENVIGDDSLHVAYSSGSIKNCHFENTAFDAIDIDISNVSLETITFKNAGNDALDLMNSEVIVTEMFVDGAQDKCLSVGEDSEVRLDKARLHRCNIGIAVKDNSRAHIENIEFLEFRQSGISLYQKNPRYSTGGTISGHNLTGIGWEDVIADRHSVNKLDKFSDRL